MAHVGSSQHPSFEGHPCGQINARKTGPPRGNPGHQPRKGRIAPSPHSVHNAKKPLWKGVEKNRTDVQKLTLLQT